MLIQDIKRQRIEWKRKGWSIPEFRGGKQDRYDILQELMENLNKNGAVNINDNLELESTEVTCSWRTYASFLKGIGLVESKSGMLVLTKHGDLRFFL